MKEKILYLFWLAMYIICVGMGTLTERSVFIHILLMVLAMASPSAKANKRLHVQPLRSWNFKSVLSAYLYVRHLLFFFVILCSLM